MQIRSAVPENGCLIFFDGRKKQKKNRKKTEETSVKHIRYRLIGGCVKQLGNDLFSETAQQVQQTAIDLFCNFTVLIMCHCGPKYAKFSWPIVGGVVDDQELFRFLIC